VIPPARARTPRTALAWNAYATPAPVGTLSTYNACIHQGRYLRVHLCPAASLAFVNDPSAVVQPD
jgi:hypothetical protein